MRNFDPDVQTEANGPLLEAFQGLVKEVKRKHRLTWWGLAELARPPLSGSFLGNLVRYPGLRVSSRLADGLRDLVQTLEALEPGSPEAEDFIAKRRGQTPKSPGGDEPATEAEASPKNVAAGGISIEAAVRALREHGFEVTLVAR